ncbi:AfsR/SARP family transcriptional regulator [Acetobacter sp.]|jgi:DNA-binding SARP family transcriptional activator|uniref:AfsR/SARP family transcriptional regulator n=1 Tax=Acetobacter sp. TaxID=440 RepID=UPI0025B83F6F|nr:BTAD domain-containing putative transcriptional regulator [Acetobacter sp.]MCH4091960.1 helix-turn-helix domain-containing protein [Acetobacter sp.]MCI1301120.1 helix-turn-helix domain-containing protein [Acetobacter sp.]MCI1317313.1 helix-turn-helix domain-containing protein [Acetobacter sp.]
MGLFGTIKPGLRKSQAAILHLDLLGSMAVQMLDGTALTPTGAKTRGLLAILALSDRRPVTRKTLAHLLWSRRSDEQARASLRQEIHRLSEALSPLGTDILDIQRHALTLKPVLTTVDAERYLNASPSGILKLPETDSTLLTDLEAVDPALDEWLTQQRARLTQHLTTVLEQAQTSLPDPEQRIAAANRLLRLDRLNENAWKTLMRELVRTADTSAALLAAEQCLATFRDSLANEPSASTKLLIDELRASQGAGRPGSHADILSERSSSREASFSSERAFHGVPNNVTHTAEGWGTGSLTIASVGFSPLQPELLTAVTPALETILDQTAVGLANQGFLAVFPPFQTPPLRESSKLETRASGDYLVQTKIQTSLLPGATEGTLNHQIRLIVRVIDQRRDGMIVWAERFPVLPENSDTIAALLTSEISWRIALAEARNSANRHADELTPLEAGLRAFAFINRKEPTSFLPTEKLLHSALRRDPQHPFLLLTTALFGLIRSYEQWLPERIDRERTAAIEAARGLIRVIPETLIGRLILARLLLDRPAERIAGLRLIEEAKPFAPSLGITITMEAYALLVKDRPREAAASLKTFRRSHPTHPFIDLFDTDIVLIFLLGDNAREAVERSRIACSMSPTRLSMLTLHLAGLAALEETDTESCVDEQAEVRSQILRLMPDFSLETVSAHYACLPPAQLSALLALLERAGIPSTPRPFTPQTKPALGGTSSTGYESSSVVPSSSVP